MNPDAYRPAVRVRVNMKQTNDTGNFKCDATVEYFNNDSIVFKIENPADVGDLTINERTLAQFLWDQIEKCISEGRSRGHEVAGAWKR